MDRTKLSKHRGVEFLFHGKFIQGFSSKQKIICIIARFSINSPLLFNQFEKKNR